MKTEIGIWEIDPKSKDATRFGEAKQVETEELLEDILVKNPKMLMRDLELVGRQVPVETGYVDLLGIGEDGRLVVFELKRAKLTRKAVAQVVDYCSHLEALPESELATLIVERSGKYGIRKISRSETEDWGQTGDSMKPVRMVLVGLGADRSAQRMVSYLAARGVDIRLLTFHGYVRHGGLLLARQARVADVTNSDPSEVKLDRKATDHGVANLWQEAKEELDHSVRRSYTQSGITYVQRAIALSGGVKFAGSHSLTIDDGRKIRITFFPASVHLCRERFEQLKEVIQFESQTPPNAPLTPSVRNQWFCRLDKDSWHDSKSHLVDFVKDVKEAWRGHVHPVGDRREER